MAAIQLTAIGRSAIFAYWMLTETLNFTDCESSDDEIPFSGDDHDHRTSNRG